MRNHSGFFDALEGRGWSAHIFSLFSLPPWCTQSPRASQPQPEMSVPSAFGAARCHMKTILFYMSCNVKSCDRKTGGTQLILFNCLFFLYVQGGAEMCSGTKCSRLLSIRGGASHKHGRTCASPWSTVYLALSWEAHSRLILSDTKFGLYSIWLFGEYKSERWWFPSWEVIWLSNHFDLQTRAWWGEKRRELQGSHVCIDICIDSKHPFLADGGSWCWVSTSWESSSMKRSELVPFLPKEGENPCCLWQCVCVCGGGWKCRHVIFPGHRDEFLVSRVAGRRDQSRLELLWGWGCENQAHFGPFFFIKVPGSGIFAGEGVLWLVGLLGKRVVKRKEVILALQAPMEPGHRKRHPRTMDNDNSRILGKLLLPMSFTVSSHLLFPKDSQQSP